MGYVKRMWAASMEPDQEPPIEVLGWIPVEARLPEEGKTVLIYCEPAVPEYHGMDMASWTLLTDGPSWMRSDGRSAEPTYWMPLPSPPHRAR